jgi:hypothetical protein
MTEEAGGGEHRGFAVIDIDGVLADVRHRVHHLERRPQDWRAFFAAARHDPPLDVGLDTARRLAEVYDVVYLSGRPEHIRRDTERWFREHDLPSGPVHLRPRGDYRPAFQMKLEVLRRLQRTAPVQVVVDDDPIVLDAVRSAGFDVLPATWMGEAPALLDAQEKDGRT